MLNPNVVLHLTEQNEIHTEGGVVHDIDRVAGQNVSKEENYAFGDDFYLVTTGYEGYGSMASYEVPADAVERIERLDDT